MREIKFRAWIVSSKKMIDWQRLCQREDAGFNLVETKDRKLMQFTGLKDKNGKEIYEGDILREQPSGFEPRDIYIAEWTDNRWGLVKKHKDFGNYERHFKDAFQMEVIGNIYENGDLLK